MTPVNRYRDRHEAGRLLARLLRGRLPARPTLVLALPRGGVPVGLEIARGLGAPLDVFLVRKLGVPWHPELAMGAIASGGVQLLDRELIEEEQISAEAIAAVTAHEIAELARRETLYRGQRPPPEIAGWHIVLVDDGVATGYTMRVAIAALQRLRPAGITVAIPVGAPDTCETIGNLVDTLVCPMQPSPFHAVGLWYEHFEALTDDEVHRGLAEAEALLATAHRAPPDEVD